MFYPYIRQDVKHVHHEDSAVLHPPRFDACQYEVNIELLQNQFFSWLVILL